MIIADRRIDRNFRYAGKKGLPGKAFRHFPVERTHTSERFLQEVERCDRPALSLSPNQRLLWGEYRGTRLRHTYPVPGPEKDQYDRARTGEQGDAPIGHSIQPEEIPEIRLKTGEKWGGGTCFGGIVEKNLSLLFGAYIRYRKFAYNF